jgi:hypothetical protein
VAARAALRLMRFVTAVIVTAVTITVSAEVQVWRRLRFHNFVAGQPHQNTAYSFCCKSSGCDASESNLMAPPCSKAKRTIRIIVGGLAAAPGAPSVPARRAVRSEPRSRPSRGPGRLTSLMRVGDSQCLQVSPKIMRLAEPQPEPTPSRAAAEPRPVFRPNRSPT